MRLSITALLASSVLLPAGLGAQEKAYDFWDEETRLFGEAPADASVDRDLEQRRVAPLARITSFALDHADHVAGDLSIVHQGRIPGRSRVGFVSSLWGMPWDLDPSFTLEMHCRVSGPSGEAWTLMLVDSEGRAATGPVPQAVGTDWGLVQVPLSSLEAGQDFDWDAVALAQLEGTFPEGQKTWFDGVRFVGGGEVIGVTDKSLEQRMEEADASRQARVTAAMERTLASDPPGGNFGVLKAFALMHSDMDLEEANRILLEDLDRPTVDNDKWSLFHTPLYIRFYYWFSSREGKFPGRMNPETEKRLLEVLWQRTNEKNDIHWARNCNVWWMDGSENHDLNSKLCNLVASRIFMNEPDYKDRVFPNLGFGGSYHYGKAGYYGPGIDPEERHGGGRANLSDGKEYTAADHYEAWLAYAKEYFRERARRGFFLERASHTYTKHTLNFVDLAFYYSGDEELKEMVGDFLEVFWADWAQESISGVRGGPKTRHHRSVGGYDGATDMASFHLGGPSQGGVWGYWSIINDFELPPVVWAMALDREGMGEYIYRGRGIGEETNEWPRPLGTERSLVCDTDSRFLKYTYVTPDYTLGTQMDHPAAVYSHLACTGRWHGMTVAQSPATRIVPVALTGGNPDKRGQNAPFDMEMVLKTVQHESTLIFQQARSWLVVNPDWFPGEADSPGDTRYRRDMGVWIGDDWDEKVERAGWIFLRKANVYAGIRPVLWDEEAEKAKQQAGSGSQIFFNASASEPTVEIRTDAYRWIEDGRILALEDNHTPVIIEAGRDRSHGSFEEFMADCLDNPLALYKTVVPSYNVMVYTGSSANAEEIVFNAANGEISTVGGEHVDYEHPMTFDSPTMRSEYKSGKIRIAYDGMEEQYEF